MVFNKIQEDGRSIFKVQASLKFHSINSYYQNLCIFVWDRSFLLASGVCSHFHLMPAICEFQYGVLCCYVPD